MRSRVWSILLLSVLSLTGLTGCEWLPEVGNVKLSDSAISITVGTQRTITATVEPDVADYDGIVWTSSNPKVASVVDGTITGVRDGITQITATAAGVTSSPCSVTVKSIRVSSVSISKTSAELTAGQATKLEAAINPSDATNQTLFWSTSDSYVATVTSDGLVVSKNPGIATITVRSDDGDHTATCEVTVKAKFIPVSGVTISSSTLSLKPGETSQLTATVAPSNATNKDVSWSSSDTSVATVASDGAVTAIAPGTATITVTTADQGKAATCVVTVNAIPTSSITLSNTSLSLTEGDSSQLTATVAPSNATNKAVSWSSSNASVAIVADDGTVTAKSAGTATITCTTDDGAKKATCVVTVTAHMVQVNYVEGGVNYGAGILIDDTIWAPVNCGYDSKHKYGLMYQWGRKYGQGYNDNALNKTETSPNYKEGPVRVADGESSANSNTFWFISQVFGFWASDLTNNLWNAGTSSVPVKTINDPCPEGWRVPSEEELAALSNNHSSVIIENGVEGMRFSGTRTYNDGISSVFLPLGGVLDYQYKKARDRGRVGFYWSSNVYFFNTSNTMVNMDFGVTRDGTSFVNSIRGGSTSGAYGCSVRCVRE